MPQYRVRNVEKPAVKRYKPQDFQVRPPRKASMWPVVALIVAAAGAWAWSTWGHLLQGERLPHELVLKSTDKAVEVKSAFTWGVLEEGTPVPVGASLRTRKAQKTVLAFGPSSSCRIAPDTELSFSSAKRMEKKLVLQLSLERGRIWLVQAGDVEWVVRTPITIVRPQGRVGDVVVGTDCSTTVRSWKGACEMVPVGHEDKTVTVGENQEASFSAEKTLTNPHPLELDKKDAFLAWALRDTLGVVMQEKEVPARGPGRQ